MSSHHFVREGQEPALFLIGDVSFSRVESLLEWAPLILVCEPILERVLSWGIRLDVVIAERGRVPEAQRKLDGVQVVKFLVGNSTSEMLSEGLKYIKGKGQLEVNVFVDDFESIRNEVTSFFPEVSVVVFDRATRWIPVVNTFQKWVTGGSQFMVLKSHDLQNIESSGLVPDAAGFVAVSDGMIRISLPGFAWIGEPI